MMNPLNITKAHQLYQVMKPHLPESMDSVGQTIKHLVGHIKETRQDMDLIEIFAILNDVDSDTIIKDMNPDEGVLMLVQGFSVNSLFELVEFFRGYET